MNELPRAMRYLPLALFSAVTLVAIATITPWPVGAFQDDAIYTVLAKALATGEGYRMINLPGAPHATHYPPGYPLVLAALWRLWPSFPDNIVLFKFANAVFLGAASLGVFWFVRRQLGWAPPAAAAAAIAGTLSIVVLLVTGVILSEPLFMALLFPTLLLAERVVDRPGARDAFAAGLLVGALALVRTIGAVALPALLIALLVRRRVRDAALVVAGAALLLLPWQLWVNAYAAEVPNVFLGKYGAYGPWLTQGYREGGLAFLRAIVVANVQSLDGTLSFAFMPVLATWPRGGALVVLALLAVSGTVFLGRRAPVTAWFLAAYGAVLLVWPFEPIRFVLAIWPVFLIVLVLPVAAVLRHWPSTPVRRLAGGVVVVAALALSIGFAVYNVRGFTNKWWASVQRDAGERAKPIAEWVARNTRPEDVLATDDDLIVYLYTGRRAVPTSTFLPSERIVPLSDSGDVAVVRSILARYRPRFFITASQQGQRTANTLSRSRPPALRPVSRTPNALVFESVTPDD